MQSNEWMRDRIERTKNMNMISDYTYKWRSSWIVDNAGNESDSFPK